ncbi:hypothetical protein HYZ99_01335 [Candidatus Peregrinibacteria bacterium]|nr:hypothetical protein [Candidatus Peregrinibacteria bacterium]
MKLRAQHRQIVLSLLAIVLLFAALFGGGMTLLRAELVAIQQEKTAE